MERNFATTNFKVQHKVERLIACLHLQREKLSRLHVSDQLLLGDGLYCDL